MQPPNILSITFGQAAPKPRITREQQDPKT